MDWTQVGDMASSTEIWEVVVDDEIVLVGKNKESLTALAEMWGGHVRPYSGKPVEFPKKKKKASKKKTPVIY